MKSLSLALVLVAVACGPHKGVKPSYFGRQQPAVVITKPVPPTARPFNAMPGVALTDHMQAGPMFRVQISADITRDVIPTDDLAIVVSVDDEEIGRYPIVGNYEGRVTRIKQEIDIPLGDYEIDLVHQGVRYAGMPFRLAEVPVWGGRRGLQLRKHQGTRISLREQKLWVGRWWANDGPPESWIIEWVREGAVVATTSGREQYGIPTESHGLVGGAAATFRDTKVVQNTLWTYGEEYAVPVVVAQTPGLWAARVVHGGSSPVAIVFTVLPGGKLAEASPRRIASVNWEESWSKPLDARALSITEVERLTAKLPKISSAQAFDEVSPNGIEPPIRVTKAAVRALFRSKALAEAWSSYLTLNTQVAFVQQAAFQKDQPKGKGKGQTQSQPREAPGKEADKRAKLRTLRTQIEQLIKANGAPWKNDERPHS